MLIGSPPHPLKDDQQIFTRGVKIDSSSLGLLRSTLEISFIFLLRYCWRNSAPSAALICITVRRESVLRIALPRPSGPHCCKSSQDYHRSINCCTATYLSRPMFHTIPFRRLVTTFKRTEWLSTIKDSNEDCFHG